MARVRLEAVHKGTLRGLELDVADGELLVLVGPSGSGKSTILRVVAGLERPTGGRVWIGERDVTDVPPQDRDVAMVFQTYALYPHKTVRENLAFPLRMRDIPPGVIAGRLERVSGMLGLRALLDRKPRELSGGERQRVALGRAMVRQPQAFLLDEPLSNLDAKLRAETRAELARIHRQLGATMLYVTPDQEEAMTVGQRVGVLHEGTLQQVAPPLEVYRRPVNAFVAAFIGTPTMNLLPCALGRDGGAVRVESGAFAFELRAGPDGPARGLLGIRPHDVELVAPSDGGADTRGRLEVLEPLGSGLLLHVAVADYPGADFVRVVVAPDVALAEGAQVGLRFRRDRLHLFERETGRRLPDPK